MNAGDWMQIQILVPPNTDDQEILRQIINRFGFVPSATAECEWVSEHGSILTIDPVPLPTKYSRLTQDGKQL